MSDIFVIYLATSHATSSHTKFAHMVQVGHTWSNSIISHFRLLLLFNAIAPLLFSSIYHKIANIAWAFGYQTCIFITIVVNDLFEDMTEKSLEISFFFTFPSSSRCEEVLRSPRRV